MVCFLALGLVMLVLRLAWPGMLTLNLVRPFSSVSIAGSPLDGWLVYPIVFVKQLMYMSLALGILNLLPIPPLDGSWILAALLPEPLRGVFELTRRFGFLIFILLAATPILDTIMGYPLGIAWGGLEILGSVMKLG